MTKDTSPCNKTVPVIVKRFRRIEKNVLEQLPVFLEIFYYLLPQLGKVFLHVILTFPLVYLPSIDYPVLLIVCLPNCFSAILFFKLTTSPHHPEYWERKRDRIAERLSDWLHIVLQRYVAGVYLSVRKPYSPPQKKIKLYFSLSRDRHILTSNWLKQPLLLPFLQLLFRFDSFSLCLSYFFLLASNLFLFLSPFSYYPIPVLRRYLALTHSCCL